MKVVVIDYGASNLKSVYNALKLIVDERKVFVSSNIKDIKDASHIIIPGVSSFPDCIGSLRIKDHLIEELKNQVLIRRKNLLGICIGMHILSDIGFEIKKTEGLSLIGGRVIKIAHHDKKIKIPHIGWNDIRIIKNHKILFDITDGNDFYFAHSYSFQCKNKENILATCDYGNKLEVVIGKENIFGAQFHPEKSGKFGMIFLRNFINL